MSEIPDDIDQIASDLVRKTYAAYDDPDWAAYQDIARAIMAERNRCAEIANKHAQAFCSNTGGETEAARLTSRSIEEAIWRGN